MPSGKLNNLISLDNISIKLATKKINNNHKGLLMIVDKNLNLLGVISDADIRRAIVSGISPENTEKLIGKKLLRNIDFDEVFNWDDVE